MPVPSLPIVSSLVSCPPCTPDLVLLPSLPRKATRLPGQRQARTTHVSTVCKQLKEAAYLKYILKLKTQVLGKFCCGIITLIDKKDNLT